MIFFTVSCCIKACFFVDSAVIDKLNAFKYKLLTTKNCGHFVKADYIPSSMMNSGSLLKMQ